MDSSNVLMETTLKLKTKVVLFSGVSLFIGLTKTLPTNLSLIGLDLKSSPKTIGWFLLGITVVLFINFLFVLILDYMKYFKKNIVGFKGKGFTGDTVGLTYDEIGEEYAKQEQYYHPLEQRQGTLGDEADDIHRKLGVLEKNFEKVHLSYTNIVEFFFSVVLPIALAIIGVRYLYCFLV